MTRYGVPILLGVVVALQGCAGVPAPQHQHPPTPVVARAVCPVARHIVIALDRSGSYASTSTAREQLAAFVENQTCPLDQLIVRWIAEDSYGTSAAIFQASLPSLSPQPQPPDNPFKRREYLRELTAWESENTQFTATQQAAGAAIRALNPEEADKTDIYGAFAKAAELLANTPKGKERLVVVASDLEDTTGRPVPFDLTGTMVLVLAFETDDPTRTVATRAEWADRLDAAGATQVIFRDPSEPLAGLSEIAAALPTRGSTPGGGP